MYFYNLPSIDFRKKREGTFFKIITGDKSQMAYILLEPGVTTDHSHENEQMGYILSGEVELTIGEEKKICRSGDAYLVPSGVRHGFHVVGDKNLEYIEIFTPPKKENA